MYNLIVDEVLKEVASTEQGLSTSEAKARLEANGANIIKKEKKKSLIAKIFNQLKNALIIILLFACLASVVVAVMEDNPSELINAGLILLIIILNTIIGLVQENKAETSMKSLNELTKPYAKVMRNGKVVKVKTEDIVVGDVVVLEAGDIVPADMRLIEVASLKIQDSAITGESMPVEKTTLVITAKNLPLGDRTNMAYMGSVVTYGRGYGVVTATGMETEMGKIADVIHGTKTEPTPLTKRLNKTVKILTYIILVISMCVFIADMIQGKSISESFMVAIALAVCIVPEGIVTCLTLTMALGVQRMSKNKAIVKHLSAVETLGSTQIICTDKTGTLTLNKMTVKDLYVLDEDKYEQEENPNFLELMNCMLLCNDTQLKIDDQGVISTLGDPTETALVHYGYSLNFNKDSFNGMFPRINEIPFDSERKLMTTVNSVGDKTIAYTKGAIDSLLERCTHILQDGVKREITQEDIQNITAKNHEFGNNALRVLAFANKEITGDLYNLDDSTESGLTFIGLVGLIDPPRNEVYDAIKTCKRAGITTVMITGDHKDTAFAIAKELKIASNPSQVVTGKELDAMSDSQLKEIINNCRVFARVNPEHKVRIVKAFQSKDKVVAMTGDGVNDAPSIKTADIGIGMGINGTDITKEVADVILTDDNFATIIDAVKEGRKIYSNILKNISYLISTGVAELIMLFTIIVICGNNFFTPALILWLNFVSDTVPALALGIEQSAPNIMEQKPQTHRGHLFSGMVGFNIIAYGIAQAILVLAVYFIGIYSFGISEVTATTMCFVTLCFLETFQAYNLKNDRESLFKTNPFNNKLLNWGALISIALTFLLIVFPFDKLKLALGITYLSGTEWLICIGVSFLIIPIAEIIKIFVRQYFNKKEKKSQ